jgi:hypothetical protein
MGSKDLLSNVVMSAWANPAMSRPSSCKTVTELVLSSSDANLIIDSNRVIMTCFN